MRRASKGPMFRCEVATQRVLRRPRAGVKNRASIVRKTVAAKAEPRQSRASSRARRTSALPNWVRLARRGAHDRFLKVNAP